MIINIILGIVVCAYVAFNFATAKLLSAKEMRQKFIKGQCVVGLVFTNAFYMPAWVLKAVRFVVVSWVK